MSAITIRAPNLADRKVLGQLYELMSKELAGLTRFSSLSPNADFEKVMSVYLKTGNNKFFLAQKDQEPIGFIQLNIYRGSSIEPLKLSPEEKFRGMFNFAPLMLKMMAKISRLVKKPFQPPAIYTGKRVGYITNIYVKPEFRNQGVATELVNHSFSWFQNQGIEEIVLRALNANQAGVSFWQKQGFSPVSLSMRRLIKTQPDA